MKKEEKPTIEERRIGKDHEKLGQQKGGRIIDQNITTKRDLKKNPGGGREEEGSVFGRGKRNSPVEKQYGTRVILSI